MSATFLAAAEIRAATVVSHADLPDISAPIHYLAWRDEKLKTYERSSPAATTLESCDALVVCGSAMACVPIEAADLFVDVLVPAGCCAVILSGGVGRGTLAFWRELAERRLTAIFGCAWDAGSQPRSVRLPAQGVTKPVLAATAELPADLAERRAYCSEADLMLELFVEQCRKRGVAVRYGGDPMAAAATEKVQPPPEQPTVFLESASTNSGANCALSAQTLARVGLDAATAQVALVQHPQAHLRACLTWEKQFGRRPLGWCPRPTEASLDVTTAEMLLYALGEFRRIEAYGDASKAFLVRPADFPAHWRAPLEELEPVLKELVASELRRPGARTAYAASLGLP